VVYYRDGVSGESSVLAKLPNVYGLRSLELGGISESRDISARLPHFSQLQSISLSLCSQSWSVCILETLSRLSQLTDLRLSFTNRYPSSNVVSHQTMDQKTSFPTLRKLQVTGTMDKVFIVLDCIVANYLQHIHIWPNDSYTYAHSRLYKYVSRFTSLREITHTMGLEYRFLGGQTTDLSEVIEPILALPHLDSLSFQDYQGEPFFHISDDCISRVALAFPSLKVLKLGTLCYGQADEWYLTFASLRCLAEACPNLVDLGLCIAFDNQSLPSEASVVSSHRLQRLDLFDTPIDCSLTPLGRLLACLFPHLESINHANSQFASHLCHLVRVRGQPGR
jgi:hypothetical protein